MGDFRNGWVRLCYGTWEKAKDGYVASLPATLKSFDDFPNLPYYIDGDVKLTQTHAIMRHLARKHNLCGTTDAERDRWDMMTEQCMDFRNGWARLATVHGKKPRTVMWPAYPPP